MAGKSKRRIRGWSCSLLAQFYRAMCAPAHHPRQSNIKVGAWATVGRQTASYLASNKTKTVELADVPMAKEIYKSPLRHRAKAVSNTAVRGFIGGLRINKLCTLLYCNLQHGENIAWIVLTILVKRHDPVAIRTGHAGESCRMLAEIA